MGFRYKYVIVDEVEVEEYGPLRAFLNYLDRKVCVISKFINSIML